ncbi:angiotensin-converting enzyme-like [Anopheles ziemanni]|uniref:angiotensin-converting enzyme-like n=1 Tax=Anopheles coustani TaxID=139045 RepID=UPI00265A6EBC|nr:angiotensin-converting enzyme-like [Anopheles coustani]XP_058177535.1 angiotensin-converting enzyme-like [Anopheles ziemanni]
MKLIVVISLAIGLVYHVSGGAIPTADVEAQEQEVFQYLEDIESEILSRRNAASEANWAYDSNITDENLDVKNDVATENAGFFKQISETLSQYDYESFQDEDLKRRVKKLVGLGYSALPVDKFAEILNAVNNMKENYAKIKVCDYHDRNKCDLALEPELTEILANSRDAEELKYYWQQWYDAAGAPTREDFQKYVDLNGEAAKLNNYATGAESWLAAYEDDTFEEQVDAVIEELRPFYEQIHGFVRYKLREFYGEDVVSEKGPIPMQLLGNMWAQGWGNIADITSPFGDRQLLDVTEEMLRQGYNPIQMFEMGDEFFQSLNMSKVPQTFWDKSILEKPDDGRDLICHASAWDFSKPDDVRIKQCTRVTMEQFFTVHHELGHVQYYLQYQHLPSVYRSGANPGFHEAVGDVLSLSVSTPKHLEKIGLLKDFVLDEESKLNQFYRSALTKLAFLPFAYTIDKYRWGIFRGEIKPEEYNCKFWEMRSKYSGVEPPVVRSEADLDAPAKYHVSADVEYLRYFVSYIIQFQFHRAACEKAGEYVKGDPVKTLNDCDIYQSAEAGNAIKAMLELGSSKPWPDAMEVLTGERRMSADALIEYFQPLYDWLVVENERLGAYVGWEQTDTAHCVFNGDSVRSKNDVQVSGGRKYIDATTEDLQELEVANIIAHPEYNHSNYANDIAIIKLTADINITYFVQPVSIWNSDIDENQIFGSQGTVIGFGLDEGDEESDTLQQATIPVLDTQTCLAYDKETYGKYLTTQMFCAGGKDMVSACNGDSGGGLFFNISGKWGLRGLVSFSPIRPNVTKSLCDSSKPTVFTDVIKYRKWIMRYTNTTSWLNDLKPCKDESNENVSIWRFSLKDDTAFNGREVLAQKYISRLDKDCVEGRLYWTERETQSIFSAKYDGTDKKVFITKEVNPFNMAVDWISRRLYWVDHVNRTIEVASLDNPDLRTTVLINVDSNDRIAVDPLQRKGNVFMAVVLEVVGAVWILETLGHNSLSDMMPSTVEIDVEKEQKLPKETTSIPQVQRLDVAEANHSYTNDANPFQTDRSISPQPIIP